MKKREERDDRRTLLFHTLLPRSSLQDNTALYAHDRHHAKLNAEEIVDMYGYIPKFGPK